MRLFGVVLGAGIVSLIVGMALTALLSTVIPCNNDKAGCGLGEAYRMFFVPVEILIGMIAFGITAPGKAREAAMKLTLVVLITGSVVAMAIGLVMDSSTNRLDSTIEIFQVWGVFASVVVVQWFVIKSYLGSNAELKAT